MPDRRVFLLLGLLAVLLSCHVAAQGVAEARARAERLLVEYRASQAAAAREDRENLRARQSDTVRAGALRVVIRQADRPVVEAAASSAWAAILVRYGRLSDAMAKYPIMIEPLDSAATQFSASARLPDRSITSQSVGAGAAGIAAGLVRYADLLLWASADSTLRSWYPSTPDPGLDSAVTAERVYLELVTSLAVEARSCLVGDDRACSEALGLREVADPLMNSYDPAGRRALVSRIEPGSVRRLPEAEYHGCLEEGIDSACLAVLRTALAGADRYSAFRLPPAVGDAPRRALVAEVVRLGGPEAWSRLIGSAGEPLELRLAGAAHVTPDSLMRVWRRGLVAARPVPVSVSPTALLMAILWGCLGLAFALAYSRWH